MNNKATVTEEKFAPKRPGMPFLILFLALYIGAIALLVWAIWADSIVFGVFAGIWILLGWIPFLGLSILRPNEAYVLTLFGQYYGTLVGPGFYFVNPFTSYINPAGGKEGVSGAEIVVGETKVSANELFPNKKISLKTLTLSNDKQKINDREGNPIEIGIVVIWRVVDTARAVFDVDNYAEFLSIQCDSALRNIVRLYPYDLAEDSAGDEKSLRGSSVEIAESLRVAIAEKVEEAGLEIVEAKITRLAYAPEIAAAMLQRQQASAVVAAKHKIVEASVGMVDLALRKLSDENIVHLDEERKAQMVSNLLVVLCGSRDAQPVVNSGSLY